jgi:UDP-2-acetamido-3-amino-2,3-dideoxy-glucuronate N-acetyltransferase
VTVTAVPGIHPSATVEAGAVIGRRTRVWHGSHVRAGSRIGCDCSLGFAVYVDTGVVIGDRCKIQNHVSLYRGVVLEDEVFVGPSAAFTNDLAPRAQSPDWEISPTIVRRGASIGANATIVCGIEIGTWALVGAGAVVTTDVPAHALVLGVPARQRGWVCECGQVLAHEHLPVAAPCPRCGQARHPGAAP